MRAADLRVLLASDGRSTASMFDAVAQLSAACAVDLTVAHVAGEREVPPPALAFEADAGPCRVQRLELTGPNAARAIADLGARRGADLVMAPAAAPGGPCRLLRPSFRARLIARAGLPVWTVGPEVPSAHYRRPLRGVACLLDFDADPAPLLQRAAGFARLMGARLHVLAVLPPVDDGTLATVLTSDTPLVPAAAEARIEQLCAGRAAPDVDVVVDGLGRGAARLVRNCRPDLLFVRAAQWTAPWRPGFPRALDGLPCPVVCIPDAAAVAPWSFEHAAAAASRVVTADRVVAADGATPWPAQGVASRAL